ncbi:MAG: hypothetical protein HY023_06350 [Chloroflexi bacterium]|nr:hypothetical protein [Chloroflexota bacterium]
MADWPRASLLRPCARFQPPHLHRANLYLDDEKSARAFLAEFNIAYPNGPDLGTQIAPLYRIKGIPETFFINRAGDLNGVYVGPISEAELRQRIEALLADAQ